MLSVELKCRLCGNSDKGEESLALATTKARYLKNMLCNCSGNYDSGGNNQGIFRRGNPNRKLLNRQISCEKLYVGFKLTKHSQK